MYPLMFEYVQIHSIWSINQIVEGNFIVRNAVGSKPTILGRKLKQSYFRGENYFELDVDVASSAIAQRVTGIACGYAKSLTIEMAIVLQVLYARPCSA